MVKFRNSDFCFFDTPYWAAQFELSTWRPTQQNYNPYCSIIQSLKIIVGPQIVYLTLSSPPDGRLYKYLSKWVQSLKHFTTGCLLCVSVYPGYRSEASWQNLMQILAQISKPSQIFARISPYDLKSNLSSVGIRLISLVLGEIWKSAERRKYKIADGRQKITKSKPK